MANWNIDWKPKKVLTYGPSFDTQISQFRSGKRQYRSLQDARRKFQVVFDGPSSALITDAIMAFFEARSGKYESFTFPNFAQKIEGTRLACVDSNSDTITDSSNGLILKGFETGGLVTIEGSGESNDGVYDMHASTAINAGYITLAAAETLAAESANAALTIYKTYNVRFVSDDWAATFLEDDLAKIRTIDLIEDL